VSPITNFPETLEINFLYLNTEQFYIRITKSQFKVKRLLKMVKDFHLKVQGEC